MKNVYNTHYPYFAQEIDMETVQYVRKTDLAHNTRRVIRDVQRGRTAVVESHGQPVVAIVDIVDYYLQRAALNYYSQSPQVDPEDGITDQVAAQAESVQQLYNLVLAHYLGGAISLGRAAELLKLPWVDLRMRMARLDIPLRVGPETIEELRAEIEAIEKWESR
jgi:predicted HTH domain antitoxin